MSIDHLALARSPQAAAAVKGLHEANAVDLSQALKTQGDVGHLGAFVIKATILLGIV